MKSTNAHAYRILNRVKASLLMLAVVLCAQCSKEQATMPQEDKPLEESIEEPLIEPLDKTLEGPGDFNETEGFPEGEDGGSTNEPRDELREGRLEGELQSNSDSLPGFREEVSLPAEDNAQAVENVEKHLRHEGKLGRDDVLEEVGKNASLGSSKIIKLQQKYKGIPVYGAETLVIIQDGKVTSIDSKSIGSLAMSTDAKLSFAQAIKQVNDLTGSEYEPEGESEKVIYHIGENFYLSWLGRVATKNEMLKIIVSASDGSVLFSAPERFKKND